MIDKRYKIEATLIDTKKGTDVFGLKIPSGESK